MKVCNCILKRVSTIVVSQFRKMGIFVIMKDISVCRFEFVCAM